MTDDVKVNKKLPGYIRLPGRRYQDINTGEIVSRRQAEKRLGRESFEAKQARNRATNYELQKQRPARGRKSTLPKKPRKQSTSNRARRIRLKNGLSVLVKDFPDLDFTAINKWLKEQIPKGGKRFRFSGDYETSGGIINRQIGVYVILNKVNIDIVTEALQQGNPWFLSSTSRDMLISITAYVLFGA